jgi:hypothetical protein
MFKFKKDRILLLKALREIVAENMEASDIDPRIDEDVSEYMIEVTDKKRARRLKMMMKELDKLIIEMLQTKKIMEVERRYKEQTLKKTEMLVKQD